MNGIYFKDGVYVIIENNTNNDLCIWHNSFKRNITIYGGRVSIKHDNYYDNAKLKIDEILIVQNYYHKSINNNYSLEIVEYLPLSEIVSHLNAIEANGVDAFLENYKKSIEFFYEELKEMNQKTENLLTSEKDDSKIKDLLSDLERIRRMLLAVLSVLFGLYKHMTAGLENEKVISVYQSIMDSLS